MRKISRNERPLSLRWISPQLKVVFFNSEEIYLVQDRGKFDVFQELKSLCRMGLTSHSCHSLFGHSTFFVALLVFMKGTSCCVVRRNFKELSRKVVPWQIFIGHRSA